MSRSLAQHSRHSELAVAYQIKAKKSLAIWTVLDQKKLISCDSLHSKFLEYHNNIHSKNVRNSISELEEEAVSDGVIVAQVFNCLNRESVQRPYPLTNPKLASFLQGFVIPAETTGCLWIHLKDLSALPKLAEKFNIHELCVSGFEDLRCHSCIIPTNGAIMITQCSFQMDQNDLKLNKLFVYAARGLVITYQQELLCEFTDTFQLPLDTIVDSVLVNYKTLHTRCVKLGPMYVIYQLGLTALQLQDTAIEYLSCSLAYFNRVVHLNLLHREKLEIMVKMHTIASISILMQRTIQEVEAILSTFVAVALGEPIQGGNSNNNSGSSSAAMSVSNLSNNGYGLKRLLCPSLIEDHHIPYVVELSDAFIFVSSCMSNVIKETERLDIELDAAIQLRSGKTNMLLSLTATVFLPMTFLAGVFGMNFDRTNEYNMEILNYKRGPEIFAAMCVFCLLVSVGYFVYQGWLEIVVLRKLYERFWPKNIDDSQKPSSARAMRRAEDEERRRERVKGFSKSLSSASYRHGSNLHSGLLRNMV